MLEKIVASIKIKLELAKSLVLTLEKCEVYKKSKI